MIDNLRSRIFTILSENTTVDRTSVVTDEVFGLVQPEIERLRARVAELEEDSKKLARLEAAGVDNWEGYSNAFRDDEDDW